MLSVLVWILNINMWVDASRLRHQSKLLDEYSNVITIQRETIERLKDLVMFQTEVIDEMNKK